MDGRRGPDARRAGRRRLAAIGVLGALALAIGVIVGSSSGGGSEDAGSTAAGSSRTTTTTAATTPPKPKPKPAAAMPGAHRAPTEPVPILMYHATASAPEGAPFPELYVSEEDFKGQMDMLEKQGFHPVTMQQVHDAWKKGGLLPSKPIVLSFDDGFRSHATSAGPTLAAKRWPGVLYLTTKSLKHELKRPQVRRLLAAGWELGSHTVSHADLTTQDAAGLKAEVVDSRAKLRREFGVPVNSFCYPAGRYDDTVLRAVQAAGYTSATTVTEGLAAPDQGMLELNRVRVNASDGEEGLQQKLDALL